MDIHKTAGHDENRIVLYRDAAGNGVGGPRYFPEQESAEETRIHIVRLVRKYGLALLGLMILGAAGGFVSVVFSSPMYRTRLLLEVMGANPMLRNSAESAETSEIDIQTQINILRSGSFLKRGADRLQSETVPLAPTGRDLFSRLRQRVRPAIQDPLENARRGLTIAMATFDARPVTRTRLIELSCESTSPEVASQFLNSMAAEFVDDATRSRMQTAQKTSEWLQAQIEETKSKLQDSEERLREFVQSSGNLFAGQEGSSTLDDAKLSQLKLELARIQADRLTKQTRYELTLKNPPESLAEVLDNQALRGYQSQISELKRQKAALETTYTPKHEKVQKVDAQLALLQNTYQTELTRVVTRIRDDYQAALRQEKLMQAAYNGQSQRVGAEAGKAAQYNALKREVETLRQMYQSLLGQANQAGLSSSVPVSPMRIVEASTPPEFPYKPRPVLNISFGAILGLAVTVGIAFLREKLDSSIRSPGVSRRLLHAPELGVIPNLAAATALKASQRPRISEPLLLNAAPEMDGTAVANWQAAPSFVAESFRGTLASILRTQSTRNPQKTILITSAGAGEGKTTVVQNLGIALAETGRKVLLVDGDFRRPHLHRRFHLPNETSLVDLLLDDRAIDEYPAERLGIATGFPGLSVLTNRATNDNIARVLYSPRLRAVFDILKARYDMILVDAPPILHLADARIIAPVTDGLILVLRSGITSRDSAVEAFQRIQEDGLLLLGTVLTDCSSSSWSKRQYYYDYAEERS